MQAACNYDARFLRFHFYIIIFYEQSYVLNCLSESRFEISSLLIKCHGITRSAGSVTDEEPGKGRGRYDRRTDAIGVAIVSVATARNYRPRMNLPCPTGPTPVPNLVVCLVV